MIGTKDGYWFSLEDSGEGRVAYTFFHHEQLLERGVCLESEVMDFFDSFVNYSRAELKWS